MAVLSYLRLAIKEEMLPDLQRDLEEMLRLARARPGFQWAQLLRDRENPAVHVVLSQWEAAEDIRAWEHSLQHEAIMQKYDSHYVEKVVHRRYSPL